MMPRWAWDWFWLLLFRPTPRWAFGGWRRFLLRRFGARIGAGAVIRPSCRVQCPWNLTMERLSCLADHVVCDCSASITLGAKVIVSQHAMLSTASLNARTARFEPLVRSIQIEDRAWVASHVFVGPGVHIGRGAVVGACAVVAEDVAPWAIVVGNPLRTVGRRTIQEAVAGAPETASPNF